MLNHFLTLSVFKSNLAQIIITYLLGVLSYCFVLTISNRLIAHRISQKTQIKKSLEVILTLALMFISSIIFISFIFNLGETYSYSTWYKRSFGPFGDGFPFTLILFLSFGVYLKNRFLVITSLSTSLLFGGKMVIIISIVNVVFLPLKLGVKLSQIDIIKLLGLPLLVYFLALTISNHFISQDSKTTIKYHYKNIFNTKKKVGGHNACDTIEKCVKTQIKRSVQQRLVTTLAGAWMTFKNGFPGSRYPGTPEKFADFMMHHNPYGLNDIFDLDRSFWLKAGAIQNAYFNFGSGYGIFAFMFVLSFYTITSTIGFRQLDSDIKSPLNSLTVFFITLALFNQTQPWIQSGSLILYLSGVSATHIWTTKVLRNQND